MSVSKYSVMSVSLYIKAPHFLGILIRNFESPIMKSYCVMATQVFNEGMPTKLYDVSFNLSYQLSLHSIKTRTRSQMKANYVGVGRWARL